MTLVALATEDELSETVGKRLLKESDHVLKIGLLLRKGGSSYLRSKMGSWCAIANRQPVLLLTDLDRISCPATLIKTWFGDHFRPPNLLFRIAVREVESWLLADHEAMYQLLGARIGKLPNNPDELLDPKKFLLNLAKAAPRRVRNELVTETGAIASQGLGYNARLSEFVMTQ